METNVRTPQKIFSFPQQLVTPMFQRPYVWNKERQWKPLWQDVAGLAERALREPSATARPHFLGAVVLQLVPGPAGQLERRTIIDGQQRLTTLQLLLDALHAVFDAAGADRSAMRVGPLVCLLTGQCGGRQDMDTSSLWRSAA